MSNLTDRIDKEIEINNTHINNFVLETTDGTKRIKMQFHKNAVNERNKYVDKEIEKFRDYEKIIYKELKKRSAALIPTNREDLYEKRQHEMIDLEELVILNSKNINSSYKLKLDFLIAKINENTSLDELNDILTKFVENFEAMGVKLEIIEFKISPFTEKYMKVFLDNYKNNSLDAKLENIFQEIYFECPEIIEHLKLNLVCIIKKYKKELDKEVMVKLDNYLIKKNLDKNKLLDLYLAKRVAIDDLTSKNDYVHLNTFLDKKKNILEYLDKAVVRMENFNHFAVNNDYDNLDNVSKEKYDEAIGELFHVLEELKEYYRYEEIIKDLIAKFRERKNFLNNYKTKEKEIAKEEKQRTTLYKKYLRAMGIGFLAKEDKDKIKVYKLQINEQIKKLIALYDELADLKIYVDLNSLNDASSIYNLFTVSLVNFSYLQKLFFKNFGEDEGYNLEEEFLRYFRFLYNPYNDFLRKINGLTEFDIASIIADKYKLLGLNIKKEEISKDTIGQTFEIVSFIKLVFDLNDCKLSINNINFIYNFKSLNPDFEVNEDEELLLEDNEIL